MDATRLPAQVVARAQETLAAVLEQEGALLLSGDLHVPAVPVREVDANGAGDVFATAFLIRYHETRSAVRAAQFAASVASYHVEQVGTDGIPTRAMAEARFREFYGA
jgi:sugar/nucleoside kinase (ribokinase family)